ncbi:MAG TPA: sigma-54 dependent transcriptional regulator [Anaerohalosphaeraceae bacterium]|nr:sigma-54 dependent transcriptional regulator [Anaerohalosphaeraceae bacterium]HPP56800.1 sigma-54 dependent transcriptional regulator [Anaerohalosphaeraceae bacterium]
MELSYQAPACPHEKVFVGVSPAFQSVLETIRIVGPRCCCVILEGETGTGKEMAARLIHALSERSAKPFIPVDCTALNGSLFESQLFGHIKGAFTGAVSDTLGFFRAADGGTIFLDEIGEMNLDLQAKLLRVLQDNSVTPVGSTRQHPVDVRVLCATNRDLKQMVQKGTFRADLYFRLNVYKIQMPPLRERREDIRLLADYFLRKQAELYEEPPRQLTEEAAAILEDYHWPGNVRELANAMEHAHIASRGPLIEPSDLPADILEGDLLVNQLEKDEFYPFRQIQKRMVILALKKSHSRKMAAARMLGIDHRKLARLVEEFGLEATWK